MNALVQSQNTNVDVVGENPFAAAGAGASGSAYVKFKGVTGQFLSGQDEEEIAHGTQFAVDIGNATWSWTFWWDGEVLETVDTPLIQDPTGWKNGPDRLPADPEGKIDMSLKEIRAQQADRSNNFMDGWGCQAVLGMRSVDGTDEEYTLKLNQGVGLNGFRALVAAYGKTYKLKNGMTPIIELDANKYKARAKNVGWRFAPVLKIVEWASDEDLMEMAGDVEGDYEDSDDTQAVTEQATTDSTSNKDADAPAGRRGRRGSKKF